MNETQSKGDLYREYARVYDMAKYSTCSIDYCVRVKSGLPSHNFIPHFPPDQIYEFAVALVDDKPVFIGDDLYYNDKKVTITGLHDNNNFLYYIDKSSIIGNAYIHTFLWKKKKKKKS